MRNPIGIIGGMGPLASAAFVKKIYELDIGKREQTALKLMLYSDPSFPDRTEVFLQGHPERLLASLLSALEVLKGCACNPIVICCVTAHHLWGWIPAFLKEQMVSLIDLIFDEVLLRKQKALLLCSLGSRKLEIFQKHPKWQLASPYIAFPTLEDGIQLHEILYLLKQNQGHNRTIDYFHVLQEKYQAQCLIAACTEIHLVSDHFSNCIDPLNLFIKKVIHHE